MIITKLKWHKLIPIALIIVAVLFAIYQSNTINSLRKDIIVLANNNKAMIVENKALKKENIQYTFTIDQLQYFNDDINQKLDSVIKDNKIKTKKIKQLQYQSMEFSKTDTILLKDTIFKTDLKIDTLLVHPGYALNLKLEYPNKIVTTPQFTNEQYIIFSDKRETINPPKKFFLARWFQKKHTVVTIDVINTNKYSDVKEKRFIEIIK